MSSFTIKIKLIVVNAKSFTLKKKLKLYLYNGRRIKHYLTEVETEPNTANTSIRSEKHPATSLDTENARHAAPTTHAVHAARSADVSHEDDLAIPQDLAPSKPLSMTSRMIRNVIPILGKKSAGWIVGGRLAANDENGIENKEIERRKVSKYNYLTKNNSLPSNASAAYGRHSNHSKKIQFILRTPYTTLILNKKQKRGIFHCRNKRYCISMLNRPIDGPSHDQHIKINTIEIITD